MNENVELSTTVKIINTYLNKPGTVSCIKYFPLLKPTKPQLRVSLEPHEIVTER